MTLSFTSGLIPSLPERLKRDTRALHTQAERSPFMSELLRGRMARPAYCALLRNLYPIYRALEDGLVRHAGHGTLMPVAEPALHRAAFLAADLNVLHGEHWAADFDLQPAAVHYVQRLQRLADAQPELLLAHAYVRYLGDLSGGQMLRRIVAQSMHLPEGRGTDFYDFGDAVQTAALTLSFRVGLGQVAVDEAAATGIVDEARIGFELHRRLFDELARAHLGA